MDDFRNFAARAKEDAKQRIAAEQAERERQSREDDEKRRAEVVQLETAVRPILEEAKSAFAAEGIPSTIEATYEKEPTLLQQRIVFYCGPQRFNIRATGGHSEVKGAAVTIRAIDGALKVSATESGHSNRSDRNFGGDVGGAVRAAVKHSLETYMATYEHLCRQFGKDQISPR